MTRNGGEAGSGERSGVSTMLTQFFELSLDLLGVASLRDGRWKQINPAFTRILGWAEADLVGRPVFEIVYPDDLARSEKATRDLAEGNTVANFEHRVLCRDGSHRWISWTASSDVEQGLLYCTGRDVTERREMERAQRESEDRQAFLLALSDALRPLGDPASIQAEAARVLGRHLSADRVNYAEIAEDGTIALVREDYRAECMPSLVGRHALGALAAGMLGAGQKLVTDDSTRLEGLTGEERAAYAAAGIVAHVTVPLLKAGRLVALLSVQQARPRRWTADQIALVQEVAERTWDAVERARAEAKLRKSERRLRTVIGGIPQLVWRASEPGWWEWSSPQWIAFTGLSEEESRGEGWLRAVHPEDRDGAREAWRRAQAEEAFEADYRISGADGSYRWFHTRATASRDETGEIVEWFGTSTDVDELRRLGEDQKVLVAELQHRVRNTLGVIRSIARRTAETAETAEDYAMHIEGRIDAFGRVQAAVTRSPLDGVDLKSLVADELLAHLAHEGEQVEFEGPAIRLHPRAAETFGLAIHELATNAVKFGALLAVEGGLRISWRIESGAEAGRLVFEWKEHGLSGISPPRRRGFGTDLLERAMGYQLKGKSSQVFEPDGLRCTIELPLSERVLAAGPVPEAQSRHAAAQPAARSHGASGVRPAS